MKFKKLEYRRNDDTGHRHFVGNPKKFRLFGTKSLSIVGTTIQDYKLDCNPLIIQNLRFGIFKGQSIR